jgi:hypothetical protein
MDKFLDFVYTFDNGYLSICGQDLEALPSFKNKRIHGGNVALIDVVTTLDASANRLR